MLLRETKEGRVRDDRVAERDCVGKGDGGPDLLKPTRCREEGRVGGEGTWDGAKEAAGEHEVAKDPDPAKELEPSLGMGLQTELTANSSYSSSSLDPAPSSLRPSAS